MRRLLLLLAWIVAPMALADASPDAVPAADDVPAEAVLAELPFLDHPEPYRIVVDLASPDAARRLKFIVDTGASHSVATPRAAAELGIRVRRHKRDPYRRRTLIGRDVQILVDTRSSDTGSRTGWEYALLGGQFLAEYVVELDFAGRRMRLLHPRRFEVPERVTAEDEAVLPLTIRMNRPGVELEVNGHRTLVLLDTGAPPPLVLSGEIAEAAGIPPSELPQFRTGSTVGPMVSELRRVDRLDVGPFAFSDFPAVVNPHGWYNLGMPSDSVVGYELLEQFTVRIDYPRHRLWLKRRPDAPSRLYGREYRAFEDLLEPEPAPGSGPNEPGTAPVEPSP
jgi:predicted aspartyl protease